MKRILNAFVTSKLQGCLLIGALLLQYGCGNSSAESGAFAPPPPQLPVITVSSLPATTYQQFPASLEGKVNVEIRAQVDGYLEKIYVDEGAYVKAGQPLFKINDHIYNEQASSAKSSLLAAQANMEKAQVEVDRLTPLVENGVIADVQLKTAKAAYEAAKASAEQAKAIVGNAQINVGYTLIKAPVSGYIGRIPFKIGSLVTKGDEQPLTLLSDVSEMYAYFSLSEPDFIAFKNKYAGNTIEEKVKQIPPVELILADNNVYEQKGKVALVEGQFDKTTGAINLRASFPNSGGTLRTGNTGKVKIPTLYPSALVVPQEATFEIQDKVFVYALADSNKIVTKPLAVSGRTTNYYFVSDGVKQGEKIVLSSQSTMLMGGLRDGMPIVPQMISTDSLLKVKPL
ncbi:efflux RND transporter periplasmic adaptor subunit [Foetidibacter luteolus]|uniref:efflux RND transporter periplasmic adaptor subunit n=1 Tax=Foetidibacter luteolus TaxID=2608880 RepID=UPI00129B96EA|nr:efflux RND transporter periplasmic adaptor subunit [Foetidibacter luteolus]